MLSEIYKRVCEKCPEAQVPGLSRVDCHVKGWEHESVNCSCGNAQDWTVFDDNVAAAIIESHWIRLLPEGAEFSRDADGWRIVKCYDIYVYDKATPIDALAAYLESRRV